MSTTLPILWSNPALPDGRDLSAGSAQARRLFS